MSDLEFKYIYHSHTKRCGHASGEDEEIVLAAINHGVKVLCMTDHSPIPNQEQEGIRMKNEELDEYVETWTKLKEKYKDQIEIHVENYLDNIENCRNLAKYFRINIYLTLLYLFGVLLSYLIKILRQIQYLQKLISMEHLRI